jgi:hypothetical protein
MLHTLARRLLVLFIAHARRCFGVVELRRSAACDQQQSASVAPIPNCPGVVHARYCLSGYTSGSVYH